MTKRAPIVARGLGVVAAACFVGAVSLAMVYPPYMSLQRLLSRIDRGIPQQLQERVRDNFGDEVLRLVVTPVLIRPCWLMPLSASMILGGLAFSLRTRRGVSDSPRWRN